MRTLLAYPEVRVSVALIHVAGHVVVLAHKGKTTLEWQNNFRISKQRRRKPRFCVHRAVNV